MFSLGSMAQWDNQKLVSQRLWILLQAVLIFIKNLPLINDKSKHNKKKCSYMYCPWPLKVIYNIYTCL